MVDTETTGVYPSDRVVEVALVTLSLDGDVLDVYETLVQPRRDVSATHIHGITASMLTYAPTFDEIAGDIAVRIHGACLVAHNLPFDLRMLNAEFLSVGGELVVTAGVDTLIASKCRLHVACQQWGVQLDGAHRALADATATAGLFAKVASECPCGGAALAKAASGRNGKVCRREDVQSVHLPDPPLVVYLASRLSLHGVETALIQYLEVVGRALSDLHLNVEERRLLAGFATDLGLSAAQVTQAHRRFVNELIDSATADSVVTDEEYQSLVRVAAALDIDQAVVEQRIQPFRATVTDVALQSGMSVCFTGEHPEFDRETLWGMATRIGLVPVAGVTKTTSLVAAADPASNSGKAGKARKYGIPIVDVRQLASAVPGARLTAHDAGGAALKVITCPDCLTTWTISAMSGGSSSKRCEDCSTVAARASRRSIPSVRTIIPPAPPVAARTSFGNQSPWAPPTIQQLICGACGRTWSREAVRGRKPVLCPNCVCDAQRDSLD
ncbi:MAG: exonuclease domain-containing protein [Ilumatobacteraceae bacterium]